MTRIEEFVTDYFEKFPLVHKKSKPCIDYSFFEAAIPVIIEGKSIRSSAPPNLNIFKGLGFGRNELMHCSFLSWLLSPAGNHDQGELFFRCFLEVNGLNELSSLAKGGYFSVSTEDSYAENGRVDIMITSKKFLVVIEAKIDACEQKKQMDRYNEIIRSVSESLKIPRSKCKLFFLTLDGRSPSTGEDAISINWDIIASALFAFSAKCKNSYLTQTTHQYAKYIQFM